MSGIYHGKGTSFLGAKYLIQVLTRFLFVGKKFSLTNHHILNSNEKVFTGFYQLTN